MGKMRHCLIKMCLGNTGSQSDVLTAQMCQFTILFLDSPELSEISTGLHISTFNHPVT